MQVAILEEVGGAHVGTFGKIHVGHSGGFIELIGGRNFAERFAAHGVGVDGLGSAAGSERRTQGKKQDQRFDRRNGSPPRSSRQSKNIER